MAQCAECGCRLDDFVLTKQRLFILWNLPLVLENVLVARCNQCQRSNFVSGDDVMYHIGGAIARRLAKLSTPLSGEQFRFACNYLASRARDDELAAIWFGFESHKDITPEMDVDYFNKLLSERLINDDIVKAALAVLKDPNRFRSRMEVIADTTLVVVDLAPLLKDNELMAKLIKKTIVNQEQERSVRDLVNEFLAVFQYDEVDEQQFKEFLEKNQGQVVGVNGKSMALVCFLAENQTAIVTCFLVRPGFLNDKLLTANLFLQVIDYARGKKAGKLLLERPRQKKLHDMAIKSGFIDLGGRFLRFPLKN